MRTMKPKKRETESNRFSSESTLYQKQRRNNDEIVTKRQVPMKQSNKWSDIVTT